MTRYTIYPIDPGDTTKIAETEALLKDLDSDAEILPDQGPDGLTTWTYTSKYADLQNTIGALAGISLVKKEVVQLEDQSTTSKRSQLVRRDVLKYVASAKEDFDPKKTEEFLDIRVQANSEYYQFLDDDGTTILGWGGLALDEVAEKAVEEYGGIEEGLAIDEVVLDRVLPTTH
jgi:hypothetical protein